MMHRFSVIFAFCSLVVLLGTGCKHELRETHRSIGFDEFVPAYNRHIAKWLEGKLGEIRKTEEALAAATDEKEKAKLTEKLELLKLDEENLKFRQQIGDYFKFATPEDIPDGLVWQDGMDQPEIGDPRAEKGGVFRQFILSFPPTIRPFGDNSNNSFRGSLYDIIDLPLVSLHPETMEIIPGVANQWAVSADGRTTYFKIDPEARYSDGEPVLAKDFMITAYVRISDNVVNPYGKQYYREEIAQIAVYDDRTLSVSLPKPHLYAPALAGGVTPSSPKFYAEYGPDYSERYQWRFPPTTGAYELLPEDLVKGVSITQTRVKDWWAKDRKYYRYRFNPDKMVYTVVRDESKAFEFFRAGMIDTAFLTLPEYWYEKSEMPQVYDGYVERFTFYRRYPKLPRGIYMNVAKSPVDNRDVRIGIAHAMNWQKVIEVKFRGDADRLNAFNEGYGKFSDPTIRARKYSVSAARAAFAKAGYTKENRDGILLNDKGQKLSIPLTYPAAPFLDQMFSILREDAKACGLDLRLDACEATVAYKKEMQKQHTMAFSGWLIAPPIPDFYQFFHSSTAHRPQTNNLNSWAREDTDILCEQVRGARSVEELHDAATKMQHIIHDEAIFSPGYTIDFTRIGSWRWVRWPDCPNTRFSPPVVYDPQESFVFWIDEKMYDETQQALRSGKTFPEVMETIDVYREGRDTQEATQPEGGQP